MRRFYLILLCVMFCAFTRAGNCIDYTNLSGAKCTYGTVANPYETEGAVDYGPQSEYSRHTIHADVAETDPRTLNQLHTTTPDGRPSVRVGNWQPGGYAESVTYTITVDSVNSPILMLQYAMVLENPKHDEIQQPHFTMELLDMNGVPLDENCSYYDFVAGNYAFWKRGILMQAIAGDSLWVQWKDWTTMGTDLSPYHGKQIQVRFTSYDCEPGAHYGYAYFAISCAKRMISTFACGETGQVTLTAPKGFSYDWLNDFNIPISSEQSILVPANSRPYSCVVSNLSNPECKFTLNTTADPSYPVTLFDYKMHREDCSYIVHFTNRSYISTDGDTPLVPAAAPEDMYWQFGNGEESYEFQPDDIVYTTPGVYKVQLVVRESQMACVPDTFERFITIPSFDKHYYTTDTIHLGETFTTKKGQVVQTAGVYIDTIPALECGSSIYHQAVVVVDDTPTPVCQPTSSLEKIYRCYGETYTWNNQTYNQSGTYTYVTLNACGADSVAKLELTIYPNYVSDMGMWSNPYWTQQVDTVDWSTHQPPYIWHGKQIKENGLHMEIVPSHLGCDSTAYLYMRLHNDCTVYPVTIPVRYDKH